jgi:hypothetical protein
MNIKRSTSNVQLSRGRGTAEGLKGRADFARTLRRPREERSQKHVFLRNEPELIWLVFGCIHQNARDLECGGEFFDSGSFGKNEAIFGDGRENVESGGRLPRRQRVRGESPAHNCESAKSNGRDARSTLKSEMDSGQAIQSAR